MTINTGSQSEAITILRDDVARAAEAWANAEYANAKSIGAGGPDKAEACEKAENKFRTLLDALAPDRQHSPAPVPQDPPARTMMKADPTALAALALSGALPVNQSGAILAALYAPAVPQVAPEQASVWNAALKEAIEACQNERIDGAELEADIAYNRAIRHVADAIRALISKE